MSALVAGAAVVSATTKPIKPLASTGFTPPKTVTPANGLGGYTALRPTVNQISAAWRVPAISAHSNTGLAGTWVGAQVGQSSFIQLGTIESRVNRFGPLDSYEAFWSDIPLHFHAAPLGTVHAGDLVTADMTHTASGWTLHFIDLTHHLDRTMTTTYGAKANYDLAEWIQEDPSPGMLTAVNAPYPVISPTTMAFLQVNHQIPGADSVIPAALVTRSGKSFIPSSLRADTFTFVPPIGYAKQYLKDAVEVDTADSQFGVRLSSWKKMSSTQKMSAAQSLASALGTFGHQLVTQPWPKHAHPDIVYSVKVIDEELTSLNQWMASGLSIGSPYLLQAIANPKIGISTNAIRHDMGLPPT
ncbi:MAG TPA: G1 family glutamic endopeptidase [Acidimicrobiales bacterium]|jgi:hypothetical protein|nr:G1 family glutamic endopeptidase [Acidimicrobiales bacterium]